MAGWLRTTDPLLGGLREPESWSSARPAPQCRASTGWTSKKIPQVTRAPTPPSSWTTSTARPSRHVPFRSCQTSFTRKMQRSSAATVLQAPLLLDAPCVHTGRAATSCPPPASRHGPAARQADLEVSGLRPSALVSSGLQLSCSQELLGACPALQGLVELPALPFSKIQYMIEYPSKPSQASAGRSPSERTRGCVHARLQLTPGVVTRTMPSRHAGA